MQSVLCRIILKTSHQGGACGAAGPASAPRLSVGTPAGPPSQERRSRGLNRARIAHSRPLSSSRPPRLGRSLRSRRVRSAAPTLDPATTHRDSAATRKWAGPGDSHGCYLSRHAGLLSGVWLLGSAQFCPLRGRHALLRCRYLAPRVDYQRGDRDSILFRCEAAALSTFSHEAAAISSSVYATPTKKAACIKIAGPLAGH
jgi:hypothetical protein